MERGFRSSGLRGTKKGMIRGKTYIFEVEEHIGNPTEKDKENIVWEFSYKDDRTGIVIGTNQKKGGEQFTLDTNEHNVGEVNVSVRAFFRNNPKKVEIRHFHYLFKEEPPYGRMYFIAGAGNDIDGWNYVNRFTEIWTELGLTGFKRVNASGGKELDILFVQRYKDHFKIKIGGGFMNNGFWKEVGMEVQFKQGFEFILNDLKMYPLQRQQQLNLVGYSYGAVMQVHIATKLISIGYKINNLVLIGSPTSDSSEVIKTLQNFIKEKKLGRIIREDIPNDKLSNPENFFDFVEGGYENSPLGKGDEGEHFDLARPGKETDEKIRKLGIRLKNYYGIR